MYPSSRFASDRRPTQPPPASNTPATVAFEGLWVLLADNNGELPDQDADGRVPLFAKTGENMTLLLGFKNVAKARQFMVASGVENAEARMVVAGNKQDLIRIARAAEAAGVLVDFDATTKHYLTTTSLA